MSAQMVISVLLVCQMRPIRAQLAQPYLIRLNYKFLIWSLAFPHPPHTTLGPAEQRHRQADLKHHCSVSNEDLHSCGLLAVLSCQPARP
jgi:hypothetical protein